MNEKEMRQFAFSRKQSQRIRENKIFKQKTQLEALSLYNKWKKKYTASQDVKNDQSIDINVFTQSTIVANYVQEQKMACKNYNGHLRDKRTWSPRNIKANQIKIGNQKVSDRWHVSSLVNRLWRKRFIDDDLIEFKNQKQFTMR